MGAHPQLDAENCDDFSCPELGTCGVQREGARCVRVCTLNEDYLVRTDDDVAQLAALRCEVIAGSLTVAGTEITSLLGLETLREVTGSLRISSPFGTLSGVDGHTLHGFGEPHRAGDESGCMPQSICLGHASVKCLAWCSRRTQAGGT